MSINQFSSKNDKQRQEILNMKKRIENRMQHFNFKQTNIPSFVSVHTEKEPQHDVVTESVDFNSTLFKNIKDESMVQNTQSFHQFNYQSNYSQPQSNLLSKIDEVLSKTKNKGKVPAALYDHILKNQSDVSEISQNGNYHLANLNKLKTIQQQIGNTLTINKSTIQKKNETQRSRPPLSSSSSIQRQKQKIRQAMGEIRKIEKIDQIQIQDKESIIFDLSDNESEPQISSEKQKLIEQKQTLEAELKQIEEQLQKLQWEEANQY